jgi:hypothetical protein
MQPPGTVAVVANNVKTFRSFVEPPGGGKDGKLDPSSAWDCFQQFTPAVEVTNQNGKRTLKCVKCIVSTGEAGEECGALLAYQSREGPGNLVRHLEAKHVAEWQRFQQLSKSSNAALKQKAAVVSQGEKLLHSGNPVGYHVRQMEPSFRFQAKQGRYRMPGSPCRKLLVGPTT